MPIRRSTTSDKKFKPQGDLKRLLDTKKLDTRLVGPIERHLMAKGPDPDRPTNVLHPSSLCKNDKCELADYYALSGMKPKHEAHTFRLETIFSEGHEYHRKWQGWLTELKLLEGVWMCPSCGHRWWDTSPMACTRCNHAGQRVRDRHTNMVYCEVPLASEKHRIAGHSDGKVGMALIEVKSVGTGTIRIEAPSLYSKYQRKITDADGKEWSWVDIDGLWRDIKRPFPGHLRQGMLYLALAKLQGLEVDEMIFIYESKATGGTKEFIVRLDEDVAEEMLSYALDIVWAVEKNRPPNCPRGDKGCSECRAYTEDESADQEASRLDASGGREDAGDGAPRDRGTEPPDEAQAGVARAAGRPDAARGLRSHGVVRSAHGLGRVLERSSGDRRDRREGGGDGSGEG